MSDKAVPFAVSLVLHQNDAPIGWRMHLMPGGPQEGHPISIGQAEEFARAATEILAAITQDEKAVTPYQVVRTGTTSLRGLLEAKLAEAESQAANIANLRRTLAELDQ